MAEALEQVIRDWLASEGESGRAVAVTMAVCERMAEEMDERLDKINYGASDRSDD